MAFTYLKTKTALALGIGLLVSGCENPSDFASILQQQPAQKPTETTVTVIEQEVEAPDVFQVTETGLWDGRPSLGGIWVAHPDTIDPEQVIVRNSDNGKFVIGSLFIRERALPGPRLQVSSDAASALGMVAGQPTELTVTALRKREVQLAPATVEEAVEPVETATNTESQTETQAVGSSAPQMRPGSAAEPVTLVSELKSSDTVPAQASSLEKPYIQIGIFGVEENARNTAESMRISGIVPTVKEYQAQGKTFYRVLVGPAANTSERKDLLNKVRAKGFTDAYFVSG
jgi:cell division septation protein DedD